MPPPKKPDAKKPQAAAAEEDLSDLSSLPHIRTFVCTTVFHFYYKKNKDEVKEAIKSLLSEESLSTKEDFKHSKTITRQAIYELAQAKIDEQNATIPEGSEKKKIDAKMIARLITEKIIELGLPLRRERKAAMADGGQESSNEGTKSDMIITLVDYPLTQEEFEAFAELRNPINKLVFVKEKKPRGFEKMLNEYYKAKEREAKMTEEQKQAEGVVERVELIEENERKEAMNLIRAYDYKCFKAPFDSVLKLSDLNIVEYEHKVPQPTEVPDPNAAQKSSVEKLKGAILSEIQKSEESLIKFCNMRMNDKKKLRPDSPQKSEKEVEETKANESGAEGDQEKPKQPVELIPAGYQEDILKISSKELDEKYGMYDEAKSKVRIYNYDIYSKNTSRVDYSKTTVGHLLISAIKQISHKDADKRQEIIETDEGLRELENLLKNDFKPVNTVDILFETGMKGKVPNKLPKINQPKSSEDKIQGGEQSNENEKNDASNSKLKFGSPYHALFDSVDQLSIQNYLLSTLDGSSLLDLEREILRHALFPGQGRHMMPTHAEKSLAVRKSDINEIITFSTLGDEQMERALLLREFEDLMKGKEKEREWRFFNRNYVKLLSKDAVKYELSRALLLSPHIATQYCAREDGLLVSLYFKNPPGRILRNQWTFNFNEIKEFRSYLNSISGGDREFLDIGMSGDPKYFSKNGYIKCNEKLMYPSDNSVIRIVKCDIGNKSIGRNIIIKDNFTFGISDPDSSKNQIDNFKTHEELDAMDKSCEFWCTLGDPSVKFFVEMENVKNIKQQEMREEYTGASATVTYQDGLVVKFLPNLEIVQMRNENSKKLKPKMPEPYPFIENKKEIEVKRVITKTGTVIRYMKNEGIQLLFANGNYSVFDPKSCSWIKTKNDGTRKEYKIESATGKVLAVTEIEPLSIKETIDPETNINVLVRSDGVMTIFYKDSTTLVMHHDNTFIFMKKDKSEIIIEKTSFAPVKVRFDVVKSRAKTIIGLGGTNALMGYDNIMERSHDGYVVETFLPDETLVESYKEKQSLEGYNNYSFNAIHIFRRFDFSILKVKQDGDVVIVTSNQRAKLNNMGYCLELGKDKDYFFDLFGLENDRKCGVYTCNVKNGIIKTSDDEGNVFVVYANGESIERLSVSFNLDETADSLSRKRPNSPRNLPDGEYIEEECKFLVPPKSVMDPRLLFIKNDETGMEFFNENQLEYFFRVRNKQNEALIGVEEICIGTEKARLLTSLNQVKKRENISLIFPRAQIPTNVSPMIQTVCIPSEPIKKMYISEKLIEFVQFSETDVDKFNDDMERYHNHKQMQINESNRLKVNESQLEFRSKEKVFEEMKFFYKILKMQGKKKKQMTEAELKIWNMRSEFTDTEDNDDEDLYSTDEDAEDVLQIAEDDH